MSIWDTYERRISAIGGTKRGAAIRRETEMLQTKLKDSLSYHTVTIDDEAQNVAVINSDNLNEKTIISLPGEDIRHGSLVCWMNNYWLVTERDANQTVYTRAKMVQCNHLLKWVSDDLMIHEQWCIVEDGTKYMTGEYEDRNFVVTRGDSRITVTIARNEHTVQLSRENRFLIDDPESGHKLAYLLTKPLKLGTTYNGNGVFKFVMQEVTATENDNHDMGVADYYKYFPKNTTVDPSAEIEIDPNNTQISGKRKGWL